VLNAAGPRPPAAGIARDQSRADPRS